jgi:hypothetical protein
VKLAAAVAVATLAVSALAGVFGVAGSASARAGDLAPQVRVNQVGYATTAPKVAYVMLAAKVARVHFEVTTPYGVVYRGTSTDDVGSWNSGYRAVYRLSIGTQLYRQLVDNAVQYFTSERDGPDVDSAVLDRQPANLTGENAGVYADADEATGASGSQLRADLVTAARWAGAYIAQGHPADGDTFNLYDTGAVAEAELLQALRETGWTGWAPIAPGVLLGDLAAQLRTGEDQAKSEAFGLGTVLGSSDVTPHAFGLYITDALYQKYGGSRQYEAFAQQQLNFALGANGWGTSFVVGAGTVFPHCMQSEIANLAGSLSGHGAIQLGATTDGPSSPANFVGLGTVAGMRACSAGSFAPFNTATAAYEDNVVAWPSVEPADDYTAASLLAFALGGAGLG